MVNTKSDTREKASRLHKKSARQFNKDLGIQETAKRTKLGRWDPVSRGLWKGPRKRKKEGGTVENGKRNTFSYFTVCLGLSVSL
jgi:hypothetical protein